jgi:hypothetical protein
MKHACPHEHAADDLSALSNSLKIAREKHNPAVVHADRQMRNTREAEDTKTLHDLQQTSQIGEKAERSFDEGNTARFVLF